MLAKERLLGYEIISGTVSAVVEKIIEGINCQDGPPRWLACLNPHSYVISLEDTEFSRALHASDFLIADGIGVVIAARVLGKRIPGRITGSDVFYELNKKLNASEVTSVFFLGSTDDCLSEIRSRFERQFPNIRFAGSYSPPFATSWTEQEVARMRSEVNAAGADILWVGMTAPKQEKWILENLPYLKVRFACAVGAVFDFYSGKVDRSSEIFQKLGLEWLPRLSQQPKRLWRRMFVSAPVFVWHVVKEAISRNQR